MDAIPYEENTQMLDKYKKQGHPKANSQDPVQKASSEEAGSTHDEEDLSA